MLTDLDNTCCCYAVSFGQVGRTLTSKITAAHRFYRSRRDFAADACLKAIFLFFSRSNPFIMFKPHNIPYYGNNNLIFFSQCRHRIFFRSIFNTNVPNLFVSQFARSAKAILTLSIVRIVYCRTKEQMVRIYTCAYIALMAYQHTLRNWADKYFISVSVGQNHTDSLSTLSAQHAIPIDTRYGLPYPATIFVDFNFANKARDHVKLSPFNESSGYCKS